ncbi:MAG TPA: hypothetical protein VHE08_04705 [Solirubrobacterales bacterium]|nr:hypothetical protein [Solirubrobacterales bacterium]
MALAALSLCAALLVSAPACARAARPPHHFAHLTRRAIVPVIAEAGGASLGERLRGARVRVYAVSPGKRGAARRRLVGRGRTGPAGVDLVILRRRRRPRHLLVVVSGGKLLGKRFGGEMKTRLTGRRQPAFVSPLSTLVVAYQGDHRHLSLKAARRAVRRYYRIPSFFDFATDLADRHLFDGRHFVRRARSHGGFDRYVTRRAKNLEHKGAKGASVAGSASGACWHEAAQTTAGFAELMGFTGVPERPTLSSCPGAAASGAPRATASGLAGSVPLQVLGPAVGVAGLIYKIVAGQSTGAELEAIKKQLNEIQAELTAIQADLGGLQAQVSQVNLNVINGNASDLAGDAVETISEIKYANAKTLILLGDATQILCAGHQTCEKPASGTKDLGTALDLACDDYTPTCEAFYSELWETARRLKTAKPLKGVEDLGGWALGSAFDRGPATAGIVQYTLEGGSIGRPFFTTADAASARLEWAYYTLYSVLDQSTYATVLSMSVGQPLPGAGSAHPPSLTVADVRSFVDELNAPIGVMIAAFPNMPDSAVIVTNEGSATHDPPYLFSQQVGGIASRQQYAAEATYELSPSAVAAGALPASGGGPMTTVETVGTAPIVLTPAAANGENWQILPNPGERRAPLPAISSAPFADWRPAWSEATVSLPQWNESTHKVERSQGGIKGPLPDLYAEYTGGSGTQTAGQWMTGESGIESTLLTPRGTGYPATEQPSGLVAYKGKSGTDAAEPGLGFVACTPAGDDECLLPTWQAPKVEPFTQVTQGATYNSGSGQLNTGLFDLNDGLVIANQQGHVASPERGFPEALEGNEATFLNQYPNWTKFTELRGVPFYGFLEALNGQSSGSLGNAAYNSGRPVLFAREQTSNDCFYWDGSLSGAAGGAGCLGYRDESGQILP